MTAVLAVACLLPAGVLAQAPAGVPAAPSTTTAALAPAQLENLVARVALYPDDLLAIMLPAATTPLDIVKAQRFLDKRKSDPGLKPDPGLSEAVRNLLNYPEIVKSMSDDLDWTVALGEAVTSQQRDVMAAIQAFRRKVYAAGNLRSDDKQIVVQQQEIVQIVPANPQVIYVPQYQPSVVVVQQPSPAVTYAPTPYPVYYYPYPPGAAFATGLVVGAATAYAFNWAGESIYHHYDVEELQHERIDYARESREDWQAHQRSMQDDRQQAIGERQTQRQEAFGDREQRQASVGQAQQQRQTPAPSAGQAQQPRAGGGTSGQTWKPQQAAGQSGRAAQPGQYARPGEPSSGGAAAAGGGAFGGIGTGGHASQQSQRGAYSRSGGGSLGSASVGGFSGGGRGGGGRRR